MQSRLEETKELPPSEGTSNMLEPEQAVLSVEAVHSGQDGTTANLPCSHRLCTIAGTIRAVGSAVREFEEGDHVLTLQDTSDGSLDRNQLKTITVAARNLIRKPAGDSAEQSLAVVYATWLAMAILQHHLNLRMGLPSTARSSGDRLFGRRILIIGGETLMGAAMVRILHKTMPDTKVVVTSSLTDQEELLSRTIALVKLGAAFAIDGDAEYLLDELKRPMQEYTGLDVVIDVSGPLACQGEVLGLLVGERILVDCARADATQTMQTMLVEEDMVTFVGSIAQDIRLVLDVEQ